MRADVS
jgi:hypothetical protein